SGQRITPNLLAAVGTDQLAERVGMTQSLGARTWSGVLGVVTYVLVLIPVLIASLNALGLEAVTNPASNMLNIILAAIPSVFAAGIVMVFAFIVGRVVSGLVTNLLAAVGFDHILALLGFGKEMHGSQKPSAVIGYLALVAILLFAFIEAARLLGFEVLGDLTKEFIVFSGHILLGLVLFAIGLYLANVVSKSLSTRKSKQTHFLALAAKIAILVFAGAMALRQMGLANEIISIAFGLILGSLAVAIALAFGLGGRDVAARHLEAWTKSLKKKR
ncbi:MAG: mechanosensitive ion channel, partial [Patescibacteria group bacterium]